METKNINEELFPRKTVFSSFKLSGFESLSPVQKNKKRERERERESERERERERERKRGKFSRDLPFKNRGKTDGMCDGEICNFAERENIKSHERERVYR